MSLVWSIGFNENDTANVRDYSESDKDATTVSNLAVAADADDTGFYGEGNGTTTDVQVTQGGGVSFSEPFTVQCQFRVDSGAGSGYMYFRTDHSYLLYDSVAGTVEGGVWDNAGGVFETVTKSVSVTTWYNVILTYNDTDKTTMYLDNTTSPATNATDASPQDTNAVRVFTDGTSYFDGRIRELNIYDTGFDIGEAYSLLAHPQGHEITISSHGLTVGQMLSNYNPDAPEIVVFAVPDANTIRFRASNGIVPSKSQQLIKVGHRWDTTKQHSFVTEGDTDPPVLAVYDGVSKFSDLQTEAKRVVAIDKDSARFPINAHTAAAYLSSAQSITNSVTTKVTFQTEEWDTKSEYDNATNYRFTPTLAGKYFVNAQVSFATNTTGSRRIYMYKNGANFKRGQSVNANSLAEHHIRASSIINMNGTTDYLEIYVFQNSGGALNASSGQRRSWVQFQYLGV